MIYINEYTGQKYKDAAECEKAEKDYIEAKKKAEEKARLDKAKREAEKKAKEEAEQKKKDQIKEAYKKAVEATDKAIEDCESYLDLCSELGYHVAGGDVSVSNLLDLLFKMI